jgi:HEAT repeat protein
VGISPKALADNDVTVRRDAAAALWRIGPAAKAAVPALAGALKDADGEVRVRVPALDG